MLKDKIKEAYAKVQDDRKNAADWLAVAKEDMKTVDTLARAQKNLDPDFDKKSFLASLDAETAEPEAAEPENTETPENP